MPTSAQDVQIIQTDAYLAAQGFSSIRNTDYQFYTSGNSKFIDASEATASTPASGYDALRNTGNHRTISMGNVIVQWLDTGLGFNVPIYDYRETQWKDWATNEVKQTNDDTTLLGTSGNDNFSSYYYSGTSWLPNGQLVNYMAGAGDDLLLGGDGNDLNATPKAANDMAWRAAA